MRYFIVLRCLLTRYVMCYGMTTKHSSWVRMAYEKFASTLHRLPKGIERDGGREYLAEAEAWEREKNIYASEVSEAYRPDHNGGAEVDVLMVQGHIKTNTSIGGTSGVWWIEAGQYG